MPPHLWRGLPAGKRPVGTGGPALQANRAATKIRPEGHFVMSKFKPYLVTALVVVVVLAILNRLGADNPIKKAVAGQ